MDEEEGPAAEQIEGVIEADARPDPRPTGSADENQRIGKSKTLGLESQPPPSSLAGV